MKRKFPPLSAHQKDLLEDIGGYVDRLQSQRFSSESMAELKAQMRAELDELIDEALHSGLVRISAESREYTIPIVDEKGFPLKDKEGNPRCLKLIASPDRGPMPETKAARLAAVWRRTNTTPACLASCHPDLPQWAKDFFLGIAETYRACGQKDYLKRYGLEKGVANPISRQDQEFLGRVLELRGAEIPKKSGAPEDIPSSTAPSSVHDILRELKKSRKIRSHVKLERDSLALLKRKKPMRVRKERQSWRRVIVKLVKEGLLPGIISGQALKKVLSKNFPWLDWSKI